VGLAQTTITPQVVSAHSTEYFFLSRATSIAALLQSAPPVRQTVSNSPRRQALARPRTPAQAYLAQTATRVAPCLEATLAQRARRSEAVARLVRRTSRVLCGFVRRFGQIDAIAVGTHSSDTSRLRQAFESKHCAAFPSLLSGHNTNMFSQVVSVPTLGIQPSAQNLLAAQRLAVVSLVVPRQALPLVASVQTTTPRPPHLLSAPLTRVVASSVAKTRPADLAPRPEQEVFSEAEALVDSALARPTPIPRRTPLVLLQVDSVPQTLPISLTTVLRAFPSQPLLKRMAHPRPRPSSIRLLHSSSPTRTTP
jgi:hypothetical protein